MQIQLVAIKVLYLVVIAFNVNLATNKITEVGSLPVASAMGCAFHSSSNKAVWQREDYSTFVCSSFLLASRWLLLIPSLYQNHFLSKLPLYTKDQQFSGNLLGFSHRIGVTETPSLVNTSTMGCYALDRAIRGRH